MRALSYAVALLVGLGIGLIAGYAIGSQKSPPKGDGARVVDLSIVDGGVYRVRHVVDGDTIVLENGLHVRYNGMNAPETGHFVKDAAPIALDATKRNIALVEDKRIRLKLGADPLDKYGRLVAHVMILPGENSDFKEETDAGLVLVKEGLAKSMGLGVTAEQFAEIKKLEDEAKAAKLGIWGVESHGADSAKPYWATSYPNMQVGLFHVPGCAIAQKIKPANRHEYATIKDAEAAGLLPCNCVLK